MKKTKTYIRSFSLPQQLAVGIAEVAEKLAVSQSSLITQLLMQPILHLEANLKRIPKDPTHDDVLVLAARSTEVVAQRLEEYREQVKASVDQIELTHASHE